jgi:hypothetical protein
MNHVDLDRCTNTRTAIMMTKELARDRRREAVAQEPYFRLLSVAIKNHQSGHIGDATLHATLRIVHDGLMRRDTTSRLSRAQMRDALDELPELARTCEDAGVANSDEGWVAAVTAVQALIPERLPDDLWAGGVRRDAADLREELGQRLASSGPFPVASTAIPT